MARQNTDRERKKASNVLIAFNIIFFIAAVAIIVKIVYLQFFWEPSTKNIERFQPPLEKEALAPERGSIIDHNGKLLAMSTPLYNVYMDFAVLKQEYANDTVILKSGKRRGDSLEKLWKARVDTFAMALPGILDKQGRNAADYRKQILSGRENNKRYGVIAKGIDHGAVLKIRELPFVKNGKYKSGIIIKSEETRQYPYDDLARRVIGYVRHNNDLSNHIGIEGKYDYVLHGEQGTVWKKKTDDDQMISDVDSTIIEAKNGLDVRTTLDIDIQDIADRSLRENIAKEENIVGGCVVILDVETAAVKAMVNLQKDKKGNFREIFNMAAGRPAEPGSVFKAVALTSLIEDGHISLETEIPTKHGVMEDMSKVSADRYISNFERRTGKNTISVVEGFEISSNYVFRRLVKDYYGNDPGKYISRLHEYNFGEAYDFDLKENGSVRPYIPNPESKSWSIYDLVSVAIGYSVRVTPLQVATFYNAIANDGKMMKPYIVESTEKDGKVVKSFKPTILNGSICSKATADTVTRALKMVTLEGTASKLKNAKCIVAGKTGTSRMHLSPEEKGGSKNPYQDLNGNKKHQATFVGFFPADNPKYTAIVVVYTGMMKGDVYGGNIPVLTFKDIADKLWAYDNGWGDELQARAKVPEMKAAFIGTSKSSSNPVPDLQGLGLRDALYALENNGYKCRYSGVGHVKLQNPAAGTLLAKGETVNLTLE